MAASSNRADRCVLTIAGSDSGAGAGVQADARTIQALGGYAATAITAITAQNTRGVSAWKPIEPKLLTAQIEAVLEDLPVRAVKTGLLPGPAAVEAVADALDRRPRLPLVIDPVIGSTSGARFLSVRGLDVLRKRLFSRAALITPNWPEAEALAGMSLRSRENVEEAAGLLLRSGCKAVLVKGGHAPGDVCADFLLQADGSARWFESRRVATRNTHGTGCVLSAAIALGLARGDSPEAAVVRARRFLLAALQSGRRARWGRGAGPAFA